MEIISALLNVNFLISLLTGSVRMCVPILLPALGEIYNQRAGILNLGLEGIILMGAITGFLGAYVSGNLWVGVVFACLAGILMAAIMAFISVTIQANQIIAGTALTILGMGLSVFIFRSYFGIQPLPPSVEGFSSIYIPLMSDLSILGPLLFNYNILVYIAFLLVPITYIILEKTNFGLKIKAVGENPRAADSKGINVALIRYISLLVAGVYAGLGGAFLSIGFMNTFLDQMSAGRGFMAIAVVIFARWNPNRALIASLIFGAATALQIRLQAIGLEVPAQFLNAFPYLLTVIILIGVSRRAEFPSAFTLPYSRNIK